MAQTPYIVDILCYLHHSPAGFLIGHSDLDGVVCFLIYIGLLCVIQNKGFIPYHYISFHILGLSQT